MCAALKKYSFITKEIQKEKEKKSKKNFDPENMKITATKVAHNRPPSLFLCSGPAAQTAQKQKFCTTKSPLMQDWVFRLGSFRNHLQSLHVEIVIFSRGVN